MPSPATARSSEAPARRVTEIDRFRAEAEHARYGWPDTKRFRDGPLVTTAYPRIFVARMREKGAIHHVIRAMIYWEQDGPRRLTFTIACNRWHPTALLPPDPVIGRRGWVWRNWCSTCWGYDADGRPWSAPPPLAQVLMVAQAQLAAGRATAQLAAPSAQAVADGLAG